MKYHLVHVPLKDGYDKCGVYFGVGKPLYEYWSDEENRYSVVRADNREEAKTKIRRILPGAKFYR